MNATEAVLENYIEEFHRTLSAVSERFFSPEQAKRLLHNSRLPATITCYVSTQFGVGFEYASAAETKIKTVRGSARVEDLFVQGPPRLRELGPHFLISAADQEFGKFFLSGMFPFRLSREEASLTLWRMRFESEPLKWTRYVEYAEIYGDRRASRWSIEAALESRQRRRSTCCIVLGSTC